MFNLFKKIKVNPPIFEELQKSTFKDKFFVRSATWDVNSSGLVHIIDPFQARLITLDPWPQIIFLESKGQQTIAQFIYAMASQYNSKAAIPDQLDNAILTGIQQLIDYKIIDLSEVSVKLPYYLEEPLSNHDKAKAKQLMIQDGFLQST